MKVKTRGAPVCAVAGLAEKIHRPDRLPTTRKTRVDRLMLIALLGPCDIQCIAFVDRPRKGTSRRQPGGFRDKTDRTSDYRCGDLGYLLQAGAAHRARGCDRYRRASPNRRQRAAAAHCHGADDRSNNRNSHDSDTVPPPPTWHLPGCGTRYRQLEDPYQAELRRYRYEDCGRPRNHRLPPRHGGRVR